MARTTAPEIGRSPCTSTTRPRKSDPPECRTEIDPWSEDWTIIPFEHTSRKMLARNL